VNQAMVEPLSFPGLRLPVAPLLAGDTAKVLAASTGHETSVKGED
jgi:hypothetical protein